MAFRTANMDDIFIAQMIDDDIAFEDTVPAEAPPLVEDDMEGCTPQELLESTCCLTIGKKEHCSDVIGLCARMASATQRAIDRAVCHHPRSGTDELVLEGWQHEVNTWRLAQEICSYNVKRSKILQTPKEIKLLDLWQSDSRVKRAIYNYETVVNGQMEVVKLNQAIAKWSETYYYLNMIKKWLEGIALRHYKANRNDAFHRGAFFGSKKYYENSLSNMEYQNGKPVFELDPDAYHREAGLDYYDKESEKELWREAYTLLRSGQVPEAVKLCSESGHAWFAAMIGCSDGFGSRGSDDATGGNVNRALWKDCCRKMGANENEDIHLRAFCGLFVGDLDVVQGNPAYDKEVCRTFEDRLWVGCFVAMENIAQVVINLVEEAYGLAGTGAREGPYRSHIRGPNTAVVPAMPYDLETTISRVLQSAIAFNTAQGDSKKELGNPYHQVQAYLIRHSPGKDKDIANIFQSLVPHTEFISGSQDVGAAVKISGPVDRNLSRFYAHYAIMMMQYLHPSAYGEAANHMYQAVVNYISIIAPLSVEASNMDYRSSVAAYCAKLPAPISTRRFAIFIRGLLSIPDDQKPRNVPITAQVVKDYTDSLLYDVMSYALKEELDISGYLRLCLNSLTNDVDILISKIEALKSSDQPSEPFANSAIKKESEIERERIERESLSLTEQMAVFCSLVGCIEVTPRDTLEMLSIIMLKAMSIEVGNPVDIMLQVCDRTNEVVEMLINTADESTMGLRTQIGYYRDYVEMRQTCSTMLYRHAQVNLPCSALVDIQRRIISVMNTCIEFEGMSGQTHNDWLALRINHLDTWIGWLVEVSNVLNDYSTPLAVVSQCLSNQTIGYYDRLAPEAFSMFLGKTLDCTLNNLMTNGSSFVKDTSD